MNKEKMEFYLQNQTMTSNGSEYRIAKNAKGNEKDVDNTEWFIMSVD